MSKEAIIGICVAILFVVIVGYAGGVEGLFYVGLKVTFGMLSLLLYSRKSMITKVLAIVVFPEMLTKFLMPGSAKWAISEIEEKGV